MVLIKINNSLPAILRKEIFERAEPLFTDCEWFYNSWDEWELRVTPPAYMNVEAFAQNKEQLHRYLLLRIAHYWGPQPEPAHGG